MYILLNNRKKIIEYVHLAFMFIAIYFINKKHFMLLHSTSEVVTVVFGILLMLLALSTAKVCENKYFQFLAFVLSIFGIVSLFVDDYDEYFQASILLQYYECILLNLSVSYINKKFNWDKMILESVFFLAVITISISLLMDLQIDFFNVLDFKLYSRINGVLYSLFFLVFLFRVIKNNVDIVNNNKAGLISTIVFKILACLSFSLFTNSNSKFNVLGHIFLNISYYYIFTLMFKEVLINPYNTLFKKLNNKSEELEKINSELDKVSNKAQSIERLNEKFINLIPDGIIIVKNKKIESANNRFLNMFGIDDEKELVNMNFTDIIDSSYHEIFESRIKYMDSSMLEKPQQYEFIWGKTKKWVEVTSLIAINENGQYVISAIRNIEDRKKAEEAEKLLELKNKEENLKNEFFANISHELKTPINVIYSALQVQNNYLKEYASEEPIVKYNKIIKQNSLRLMRLINNIIDITRIESSFFKPNYKIENIISIVEEISMSIVEYVKSKKITLIFDTEIEEAYVRCDSDLIERIMLNLLSNAVKYGKEGGNIYVNIYQHDENSISVSVKDDGIGIPDEMLQKIFDRFLKVDNSLSRKTEGSGIGLSLVKQLVEIHEGTITCDSKLNIGTEFKIIFPTVEYSLVDYSSEEDLNHYSSNAIEPAEVEFSDIYY